MISILIPTRGRHERLRSLVKNILNTSLYSESNEICFYADEDDTSTIKELEILSRDFCDVVKFKKGPKVIFSDLWNQCLSIATKDYYMICGDDVVFETQNWDEKVLRVFKDFSDKIVYVGVNDVIHNDGSLAVHGIVHKNWVDALGYLTPKIFIYNYADNWIDDIAKMINRRIFLREVIVRHNHWIVDSTLYDTTYDFNFNNYRRRQLEVDNLYRETLNQRKLDAKKLLDFINNFSTSKKEGVL
uniref:Glycosyltransferase n=1 Tax=Dictyoglomus turgidum TaxID=513050 RepID=A0A7C3SMM6_9BACT